MAFTLVSPAGGWSLGATFTSAQANAIAADLVNALDKSTAGDTLAGVIAMLPTAQINASNLANIVATAADAIQSQTAFGIASQDANGIVANVPAGIVAAVANGIQPLVANGINDGGVASGVQPSIYQGFDSEVYGGFYAGVPGGFFSASASGFWSSVAGSFVLDGGSSDWPTFGSPRVRNNTSRVIVPDVLSAGWTGGWGAGGFCPGIVGPGTSTPQRVPLLMMHDGATLTFLKITFAVAGSHAGGIGSMVMPAFTLYAISLAPGAGPATPIYLSSTNTQSVANPGSGAGWYNSGLNQFFTFSCNQNNVINSNLYVYVLEIVDENGTGSASGNFYLATTPTYNSIPNMAFP